MFTVPELPTSAASVLDHRIATLMGFGATRAEALELIERQDAASGKIRPTTFTRTVLRAQSAPTSRRGYRYRVAGSTYATDNRACFGKRESFGW